MSSTKVIVSEDKKLYTRSSIVPIIVGVVLFIIFGLIFIFGLLQSKSQNLEQNQNLSPAPKVNFVASKGITIYNQKWEPFTDDMLKKLQPGQQVTVGIETVKGTDVDMARIRFNKNVWDESVDSLLKKFC